RRRRCGGDRRTHPAFAAVRAQRGRCVRVRGGGRGRGGGAATAHRRTAAGELPVGQLPVGQPLVIRLRAIERGRGLRLLVLLPVLRVLFGRPIPGFVKILLYRHEFFGQPVGRYAQEALRGPGRWSVGERELF